MGKPPQMSEARYRAAVQRALAEGWIRNEADLIGRVGAGSRSAGSRWKTGGTPEGVYLFRIARALHVTIEHLLELDAEEREGAMHYVTRVFGPTTADVTVLVGECDEATRVRLREWIKGWLQGQDERPPPPPPEASSIMLRHYRIAAGKGLEAVRGDEEIALPAELAERHRITPRSAGRYYALSVVGESMTGDNIRDGDVVLIREARDVPEGLIAVLHRVSANEVTLKRYARSGDQIRLLPSGEGAPFNWPGEDTEIQGGFLAVIRRAKGRC